MKIEHIIGVDISVAHTLPSVTISSCFTHRFSWYSFCFQALLNSKCWTKSVNKSLRLMYILIFMCTLSLKPLFVVYLYSEMVWFVCEVKSNLDQIYPPWTHSLFSLSSPPFPFFLTLGCTSCILMYNLYVHFIVLYLLYLVASSKCLTIFGSPSGLILRISKPGMVFRMPNAVFNWMLHLCLKVSRLLLSTNRYPSYIWSLPNHW